MFLLTVGISHNVYLFLTLAFNTMFPLAVNFVFSLLTDGDPLRFFFFWRMAISFFFLHCQLRFFSFWMLAASWTLAINVLVFLFLKVVTQLLFQMRQQDPPKRTHFWREAARRCTGPESYRLFATVQLTGVTCLRKGHEFCRSLSVWEFGLPAETMKVIRGQDIWNHSVSSDMTRQITKKKEILLRFPFYSKSFLFT